MEELERKERNFQKLTEVLLEVSRRNLDCLGDDPQLFQPRLSLYKLIEYFLNWSLIVTCQIIKSVRTKSDRNTNLSFSCISEYSCTDFTPAKSDAMQS